MMVEFLRSVEMERREGRGLVRREGKQGRPCVSPRQGRGGRGGRGGGGGGREGGGDGGEGSGRGGGGEERGGEGVLSKGKGTPGVNGEEREA